MRVHPKQSRLSRCIFPVTEEQSLKRDGQRPWRGTDFLEARFPRKEVIQPHLPVRLPCYDFVPITTHTFGTLVLAVPTATSGTSDFRDVTGGVYKARELIHRGVADPRLLAIPASRRRVAASDLNWDRVLAIRFLSRGCSALSRPL